MSDMTRFLLIFALRFTAAFLPQGFFNKSQIKNVVPRRTYHQSLSSNASSQDRDPSFNDSKSEFTNAQANFLESSARDGSTVVRQMSIEERTKRALLAEAAEDRMMKLTDDLDKLLGDDGMPKNMEDREEVINIARQIKASQEQYRSLVNGEPSPLIDALDGNGNMKNKSTGRDS